MKKSVFLAFGPVLATVCALHLFCIGFDSPSSPDKTNVAVVFMASNSEIYQNALVDSVGKEICIGAALYLPANFDSIEIRVLDNGSTVTDTVFRTFRTDYFKDTVWISYTFLKPGVKNVTVTPFVTPARSSLGATITIHGIEPTPRDTIPPVLSLVAPPDTNATITTDTFTIDLQCSDSSGVASVSADMGAKTFQATMKNGHYAIPITGFASGEINVVTVHATDSSAAGNTISRKLYFDYQPITHPVKYKIVYNGNGNTGGTIPVDSNTYEALATVMVKENTGSLVTSGYSFTGWNTAAAGDGALYAEGATFVMGSADVILYAQWAVNRYTVTFNSMEGSVVTSQAVDHGGNITEPAAPIRTGYIFGGWYEDKTYASIWNFTTGTIAANDTLYAKWNTASYTVTFDGQSVMTNSTMQVTFPKTTIDTLPALIASGYRFDGWYTGSNGGGSPFLATTVVISDITVYAKWTRLYRVTYDVNGGTGTVPVDPNTYQNSNTVMVLSGSGLSKTDYTFAGWNTQADTLGTSYNSGGPLIMGSADVTLYAKWRMNAPTIAAAMSNKACPVNDSVTFSVTPTGLDLRYTWYMNKRD